MTQLDQIITGFGNAIVPDPDYSVSEHAERTLYLSERTSAISGLLDLSRTPYLRHPLDSFSDPRVTWITFCSGTQVGKTVFLFALLNYIVDHSPAPTMLQYPTMDLARDLCKDRLHPLFLDCPNLKKHMTRWADDFALKGIRLDRMMLRLAWNSLPSVSSHPEKYLLQDECKDTDPLILKSAEDRTDTFWDRKIVKSSSPLVPTDNIWQETTLRRDHDAEEQATEYNTKLGQRSVSIPVRRWKTSKSKSVHFFEVPCPHCGEFQQLYPDRLIWPRDCAIRDLTFMASYVCIECGEEIKDHHKPAMVRSGRWTTDNPGCTAVVYWMPSLYSLLGPSAAFGELVGKFLRAHVSRQPEHMQALINGKFAWPWDDEEFGTDTVDLSHVYETPAGYLRNTLPDDVKIICAGMDLHKYEQYVSIWGWGGDEHGRDGQLLHWETIGVDVSDKAALEREICRVRAMSFEGGGRRRGVLGIAIDSGYETATVYGLCRKYRWLKAVKGLRGDTLIPDGLEKYINSMAKVDKMPDGSLIPDGLQLYHLNTGIIKRELYAGASTGRISFPTDIDNTFLRQFASEKIVVRVTPSGKVQRYYVKKKDRDESGEGSRKNHYLDTAVYARALVEIIAAGMTLDEAARKFYPSPKKKPNKVSYIDI